MASVPRLANLVKGSPHFLLFFNCKVEPAVVAPTPRPSPPPQPSVKPKSSRSSERSDVDEFDMDDDDGG